MILQPHVQDKQARRVIHVADMIFLRGQTPLFLPWQGQWRALGLGGVMYR